MAAWMKRNKAVFAVLYRVAIAPCTVLLWRYTGGDTQKIAPFAAKSPATVRKTPQMI